MQGVLPCQFSIRRRHFWQHIRLVHFLDDNLLVLQVVLLDWISWVDWIIAYFWFELYLLLFARNSALSKVIVVRLIQILFLAIWDRNARFDVELIWHQILQILGQIEIIHCLNQGCFGKFVNHRLILGLANNLYSKRNFDICTIWKTKFSWIFTFKFWCSQSYVNFGRFAYFESFHHFLLSLIKRTWFVITFDNDWAASDVSWSCVLDHNRFCEKLWAIQNLKTVVFRRDDLDFKCFLEFW